MTVPSAAALRVLGIDPGLTRCGVGIVDVEPSRRATLVYVGVIRTPTDMALEQRVLAIGEGIACVVLKPGLACDEAAYTTGSTYVVDGGLMRNYKEQ